MKAKKNSISKPVQIFWRIVLIGFGSFFLMILLANWGLFGKMPSIQDLENPTASLASEVIADDGTVMGKYYLEDRTNTDFKNISKHIINALISTEDVRFYNHSGIDGKGVARALIHLGTDGGAGGDPPPFPAAIAQSAAMLRMTCGLKLHCSGWCGSNRNTGGAA